MKILLIRPSTAGYATPPPDTPSGLMYLAASARIAGHEVEIRDLEFDPLGDDLDSFDAIGITILSKARQSAFKTVRKIREQAPNVRIVAGGPHVSSMPDQVLDILPVNAVVVGEGEQAGIDALESECDGLYYSKPLDIDSISFPAYDLVDLDRCYMQIARSNPGWIIDGIQLGGLKYAPMIASRGCPGRCTYCSAYKHWGLKIRRRSAENVVDEMEMLNAKYGVSLISFNDNCFPSSKSQGMAICAEIQKRGLRVLWKADTRADIVDAELAIEMRRAGCFMVAVGLESASPTILKNINKKLDLDKARESLLAIKGAGMIAYALLMIGNPCENWESINETTDYLNGIRPHLVSFVTGVMILPDTEMATLGGIDDEFWATGDDLPYYLKEHTMEELTEFSVALEAIHKDPLPAFGG